MSQDETCDLLLCTCHEETVMRINS